MFNGIIYNQGLVTSVQKSKKNSLIGIKSKYKFAQREIGSSIACNGVCLTLVSIRSSNIFFFVSYETLKRSNFSKIKKGDYINLEKSLVYGNNISGHYVQGHVDTTGLVKNIIIAGKSWVIKISINAKYMKFLVDKASISINGVSLTISKIASNNFEITVIPHTLKLSNLKKLKKNDTVNIEFDIFSKYLLKISN